MSGSIDSLLPKNEKVEDVCGHLMITGLVSYKDVSISSLATRDELS
jgi:hypothetical protein